MLYNNCLFLYNRLDFGKVGSGIDLEQLTCYVVLII